MKFTDRVVNRKVLRKYKTKKSFWNKIDLDLFPFNCAFKENIKKLTKNVNN